MMRGVPPFHRCDLCNRPLRIVRVHELTVLLPGQKLIPPQRHQSVFRGACPVHGERFRHSASEGHSTILRTAFRKLFSKDERRAIRAKLADDREERKNFNAAANGQYKWDRDDVARWNALL